MEPNNIEIADLSQDLFNTSNISYESNNYDLAMAEFTDSNQAAITSEQILFIDSQVEDYQALIDNLIEPTEVVILDAQPGRHSSNNRVTATI